MVTAFAAPEVTPEQFKGVVAQLCERVNVTRGVRFWSAAVEVGGEQQGLHMHLFMACTSGKRKETIQNDLVRYMTPNMLSHFSCWNEEEGTFHCNVRFGYSTKAELLNGWRYPGKADKGGEVVQRWASQEAPSGVGHGTRSDLHRAVELVRTEAKKPDGMTWELLCTESDAAVSIVKYGPGMLRVYTMALPPVTRHITQLFSIEGPSGCGKTTITQLIRDVYAPREFYYLETAQATGGDTPWATPDIRSATVLCINEFDGTSLRLSVLKRMWDDQPIRWSIKGQDGVFANPHIVLLTSQTSMESWYSNTRGWGPGDLDALRRRIKVLRIALGRPVRRPDGRVTKRVRKAVLRIADAARITGHDMAAYCQDRHGKSLSDFCDEWIETTNARIAAEPDVEGWVMEL